VTEYTAFKPRGMKARDENLNPVHPNRTMPDLCTKKSQSNFFTNHWNSWFCNTTKYELQCNNGCYYWIFLFKL